MRKRIFLASLLIFSLYADESPIVEDSEVAQAPWFTGPLFAPASNVIPGGHYNIEPYLFAVANTASYNDDWKTVKKETSWNNYFQPLIQVGITKWMDSQTSPAIYYNYKDGAAKWVFGDFPLQVGFQLYNNGTEKTLWTNSLKFNIRETFPTGKYRNLDPKKLGTDIGGQGSWQTTFQLVWGNLTHFGKDRFFCSRLNLQYTAFVPVHVKNLNAYGGGPGTDGKVYPGQNVYVDWGGELTLTRNWVFAFDLIGSWTDRTRFKGKTAVKNTLPPSFQFSFAPAIEYNWNASLGIIFGPWFTLAGRNSLKFASGVFALNYYH